MCSNSGGDSPNYEDFENVERIISQKGSKKLLKNQEDYMSERSGSVNSLIKELDEQQKRRFNFKSKYQKIIVIFFLTIVTLLTVGIILMVIVSIKNEMSQQYLVALISSCVTYLTSVISILRIIVKYIFPCDEDKLLLEIYTKIIEKERFRE